MNVEQARFNMIEQQIRPWDVLESSVLELLAAIRREDFVPAEHRALTFMDTEVPLNGGQSMLAPRVEARLLQELKIARHEKVLEVGTGSGFMAALLGHKAQRVETMEIDPQLAEQSAAKLKRAGLSNVRVHQADGSQGLASEAPFDAILLSGSVAEVPQALLAQLKIGGRLVAVVGAEPMMVALIVTRKGENEYETHPLFDVVVPRLVGFAEKSAFAF